MTPAGRHPLVLAIELALFLYFTASVAVDFAPIAAALWRLPRRLRLEAALPFGSAIAAPAPPVSVVVAAHNESPQVVDTIRSLLDLDYAEHEVIVVNDGSTDETMALLISAFGLVRFPVAPYRELRSAPIRAFYRSPAHPGLLVIDKDNGGKGDALNAALNAARCPLVFAADADSWYRADTLSRLVAPFVEDSTVVGCGGGIGVLNETVLVDGVPRHTRLPRNWLVRFQVLEYLRAAFNSRFGWSSMNAMMSVSGACAMWRRDVLVSVGGFAANTLWEDLEITVRVHHAMRARRSRYRIAFVPCSLCWTSVPSTIAELRGQRRGWQRHLTESLFIHREMLFGSRMGLAGWFAYPAYVLSEWLAPAWLLFGTAFLLATSLLGVLSGPAQLALLALILSLSLLRVSAALLLDEISARTFRLRDVFGLLAATLLEQIGYRQVLAWWHLAGTVDFFRRAPIRGTTSGIASWSDAPYRPSTAAASGAAPRPFVTDPS